MGSAITHTDLPIPVGSERVIDGQKRVYCDGYWVKAYDVPADTLTAKKKLIEALTRRLFNHVEHGVNIPGSRLEEARRAFDTEDEPGANGSRAPCWLVRCSIAPPTCSPRS